MPCSEVTTLENESTSPAKRGRTEDAAGGRFVLKFARLSENATIPTRGSTRAAGYDLYRLDMHFITMVVIKQHAANLHDCVVRTRRSRVWILACV